MINCSLFPEPAAQPLSECGDLSEPVPMDIGALTSSRLQAPGYGLRPHPRPPKDQGPETYDLVFMPATDYRLRPRPDPSGLFTAVFFLTC